MAFLVLVIWLYFTEPWTLVTKPPRVEGNPVSIIYAFAASKTEGHSVEQLMNRSEGDASGMDGRIGTNEVVLFITGIGPKSARSSVASALLSLGTATTQSALRRPDAVVVVGMCGSLTSAI